MSIVHGIVYAPGTFYDVVASKHESYEKGGAAKVLEDTAKAPLNTLDRVKADVDAGDPIGATAEVLGFLSETLGMAVAASGVKLDAPTAPPPALAYAGPGTSTVLIPSFGSGFAIDIGAVEGTIALSSGAPGGGGGGGSGAGPTLSKGDPPKHESSPGSKKGHTIEKHVGKTQADLEARMKAEPHLKHASTFATQEEAENAINAVLAARSGDISAWLATGPVGKSPAFKASFSGGEVLARGATATTPGTSAVVVLKGTGGGGWHILTAYPTN